jgi:RNA polymerase sigma-70 factor (ECF subfamily)
MRRCNDPDAVLDVVQDTFVAVWRDARKWRGDGEVAAWLWGIGFRRMVSRLRKNRATLVLLPDWEHAPTTPTEAAEDAVLLSAEYGHLGGAMARLSPEFRAVVQAVVLDGLTTREAGRLLGVRENTVKTRLHRAKAQLRRSLEGTSTSESWR